MDIERYITPGATFYSRFPFIISFMGIVLLIVAIVKPNFFWENDRTKSIRKHFGDQGAVLLYVLIALIAIAVGFF